MLTNVFSYTFDGNTKNSSEKSGDIDLLISYVAALAFRWQDDQRFIEHMLI